MSNHYPPTPSFAGTYPGYPFTTTTTSAVLQDGAYQATSGFPPQGLDYSISTTPTNPNSAVNAQIFLANAHPSQGVPPPMPHPFQVSPDFFQQFAKPPLPPPPYPPVPISHLGFAQFPPPLPNFAATSTPPSHPVPKIIPIQPLGRPNGQTSQAGPETLASSHIVSREEGELSDGELDDSRPGSTASKTQAIQTNHSVAWPATKSMASSTQRVPSPGHLTVTTADLRGADAGDPASGQAPSTLLGVSSQAENMGNVFQRQSYAEENTITGADDASVSSYNPPSASTPDPEETAVGKANTTRNGLPAVTSLAPAKSSQAQDNLVLREQVKDALRSLESHNIKYDELVGEGVDSYVLRRLYKDLGQANSGAKHSSADVQRQPSPVANGPAEQPLHLPHEILDVSSDYIGQHLETDKSIGKPSNLSSKQSGPDSHEEPNIPKPFEPQAPVEARSEKATAAPPPSSTAMERKDRIAQLLAAKTGKPLPPRPPPEREVQLSSKSSTPADPPSGPLKQPSPPPEKASPPSLEASVKPKNRAQTELIRQKMEALKKEALAKTQTQGIAKAAPISSPPAPATSDNLAHPQYATALADSISAGFQIPGLFMTSEPHPHQLDNNDSGIEDTVKGNMQEPRSTGSVSDSLSRLSSAGLEEDAQNSPDGHNFPLRLPQKRPLASDSFDEPRPASKRPFGRKISRDKVEIVVSDLESEGEVEDVEMELDNDSEAELAPPQEAVPPMSLRERSIRDLPPLTDLPSPRPIAASTGGVGTPNSTAVQTPGREREKRELWKAKHEEIELLRKKIVEMEEKRKAKLNARPLVPNETEKAALPSIRTTLTRPVQQGNLAATRQITPPKTEAASDPPRSPFLSALRPEGMANTPTPPASPVKEALKASEPRQKLLQTRSTRQGTPSAAEVELRQAQLAEKRAKVAELRREAERREAEIMEEARMLEMQLQAGLDEEAADADRRFHESPLAGQGQAAAEHNTGVTSPDAKSESQGGAVEGSPLVGQGHSASPNSHASHQGSPESPPLEVDPIVAPSDLNSVTRRVVECEFPSDSRDLVIRASQELREEVSRGSGSQNFEVATMADDANEAPSPARDHYPSDAGPSLSFERHEPAESVPNDAFDETHADDDGSVSMSDSVSDDYEPAEPQEVEDNSVENGSDLYEPVEVSLPIDVVGPAASTNSDIREANHLLDLPVQAQSNPSTPATETKDDARLVDDSEDGMQLTEPDVINKAQGASQPNAEKSNGSVRRKSSVSSPTNATSQQILPPTAHFVPYETPRRYFKSFRYYDRFGELVPSGYKSMTFSNNIDPKRPFCPTELAGEECQDPKCEEQHFFQVALTDDKILAQMSTANNLESRGENELWVAGLRQVIADLRSRGVKDFHLVASALAAYRRRFSEELSTSSSAPSQS